MISFHIDDEKLFQKHKNIWTKIKYIELNALSVYDDRHKTRTYGDKVYPNFRRLNVPENDIECESFTFIFIDSLFV